MEPLAPILIGASVAAIVVVAVRRVVRRRSAGAARDAVGAANRLAAELTAIVLGILLMVLTVLVGQRVLEIKEPPRGELFAGGVGIATAVKPKPSRGFMASLGARFTSCSDPVEVTIVLAGSAEYFEDHQSELLTRRTVTVALPGRDLHDVRLGYGGDYGDLFDPLHASPYPEAHLNLTSTPPREHLAVTSVTGRIAKWSTHVAPLVVRFKADWLAPRGLKTCYLKLPPLTGEHSIIAAQDARGRSAGTLDEFETRFPTLPETLHNDRQTIFVPLDTSLTLHHGISVVQPGENDVIGSEPDTQVITGGLPALACSSHSATVGNLGDRGHELVFGSQTGVAIRDRSFSDLARELNCGGLFTMAEAGANSRRDLVLLIIGAVFSLGAAIVLEMVLDIQRRRLEASARASSALTRKE
jgi:hypothetical protein